MPTEGVGKRELPSNLGAALKEVKGEDRDGVLDHSCEGLVL